ncbi:hypothetical protein GPECTOR_1g247 [Gonium pectorale]|uniref:Uncharacterized protein n=1 Tax=Gonium pectorale TaxID=33097 RepID=A0A150H2S0_GONPE|nr:hypothetical protein GPECTOR_1g247 [Gonium pectorale]|eukprot:KXZ56282.1 hypothetical protein GPECTOR_1g247 [Gonium pectorale]
MSESAEDCPGLELIVLGTGAGTSYVYFSELPVVLAVESKAAAAEGRGPPCLYAHPDVMGELLEHRLRELLSTGKPLDSFASFHEVPSGTVTPVGDTGLALRPFRSRHSETCYGAVLYHQGSPVLGWTADSGYDEGLYEALSEAPVLLLDARAAGTEEHAGFDELERIANLPYLRGKRIVVTGYGRQDEAPQPDGRLCMWVARPGMRLPLSPGPEAETSQPAGAPAAAEHDQGAATREPALAHSCQIL